jgi:hypothetical protein
MTTNPREARVTQVATLSWTAVRATTLGFGRAGLAGAHPTGDRASAKNWHIRTTGLPQRAVYATRPNPRNGLGGLEIPGFGAVASHRFRREASRGGSVPERTHWIPGFSVQRAEPARARWKTSLHKNIHQMAPDSGRRRRRRDESLPFIRKCQKRDRCEERARREIYRELMFYYFGYLMRQDEQPFGPCSGKDMIGLH